MQLKNRLPIEENVPLAPLTTLGVGGAARFFLEAREEKHVVEGLDLADSHGWPVFVLGGGSNLVISDDGFPGLVVRIALKGVRFEGPCDSLTTVAAGEAWDDFVAQAVVRNLQGVECLSGIPGTVGGTPVQNVGAYGQDVGETIVAIRALDRQSRKVHRLDASECLFAYRSSIFNTSRPNRYIVLDVSFQLKAGGHPCLKYADLQKRFSDTRHVPSLSDVRQAVVDIREGKGMVIRSGTVDSRSAGSFFKNVLAKKAAFQRAEERAHENGQLGPGESFPRFETADGLYKIPAAWLIERAGFARGCVRGPVGLSTRHTLAIINRGGARARDLIEFMREIQARVKDCFGFDLIPEPVFVGFE